MNKVNSWNSYADERQQLLHQSQSQSSVTPTKWYDRGKFPVPGDNGASSLLHPSLADRTPHISHSWVFRTHRSAAKNTNGEKQSKTKPVATSVVNIEEMKRKARALEEIYEQKSKALQELYKQKRRILDELYQQRFGGSELSFSMDDRLKKAAKERRNNRRYLQERFSRLLDGPGDRNFDVPASEYDLSSVLCEDDDMVAVFNDKIFEEEFARNAPVRYTFQEERYKAVAREPMGCRSPFHFYSRIGPYRPSSAPNSESTPHLQKSPLETTYIFPNVADYPEPGQNLSGGYLLGCAVKPRGQNRANTLRTLRTDELTFRRDSPWMQTNDSAQKRFAMRPHSAVFAQRQDVKAATEHATKGHILPRLHPVLNDRVRYYTEEIPSRPFTVPAPNTFEDNEKETMENQRIRKKHRKRWFMIPREQPITD